MSLTALKRGWIASAILMAQSLCAQMPALINEPVDIAPDFRNFANIYFLGDSLAGFTPATAESPKAGNLHHGNNTGHRLCVPASQNVLQPITVTNNTLAADPFKGSVKWTIHAYNAL